MEGKSQRPWYQPFKTDIIWMNVSYMTLLHVGALYCITLLPDSRVWTLLWGVVLYVVGCIGVTAGVHRLWAHRSYKAKLPLRVILMLFNCVSGQNSIFDWARKHRSHHKFSETDADPHNSKRGFFFSHIGWLLLRQHSDVVAKGKSIIVSDLMEDPVVRFQKRYYKILMILFNIILPTLIPTLWGESICNAYFVAFLLRYTIILNVTWTVNSIAHMWGNRPYDTTIRPAENMLVAIGSLGEGFHNYHHAFPFDYRTSEFGFKINVTSIFINFFKRIGWAYDLKAASKEMVYRRRLRTGTLKVQRRE